MIPAGSLVVVHNHDHKESYIAELLEDLSPRSARCNPLVRILWMLEYPRQTAIMYEELLCETTPLEGGTRLRMAYVCQWPVPWLPDGWRGRRRGLSPGWWWPWCWRLSSPPPRSGSRSTDLPPEE